MSKIVLDDVISGYGLSKINENFQKIQDELNDKVLYRDNPDGETNTLEQDVDVNGFSLYNVEKINGMVVDSLSESAQLIADNVDLINSFAPYLDDIQDIAEDFNAELDLRIPEIANYAALAAYTGDDTAVYVKGVSTIFDGGHGVFRRTTDTPSSVNGIYRQDGLSRWWKREFNGKLDFAWFGGIPGGADCSVAWASFLSTINTTRIGGQISIPGEYYIPTAPGSIVDAATHNVPQVSYVWISIDCISGVTLKAAKAVTADRAGTIVTRPILKAVATGGELFRLVGAKLDGAIAGIADYVVSPGSGAWPNVAAMLEVRGYDKVEIDLQATKFLQNWDTRTPEDGNALRRGPVLIWGNGVVTGKAKLLAPTFREGFAFGNNQHCDVEVSFIGNDDLTGDGNVSSPFDFMSGSSDETVGGKSLVIRLGEWSGAWSGSAINAYIPGDITIDLCGKTIAGGNDGYNPASGAITTAGGGVFGKGIDVGSEVAIGTTKSLSVINGILENCFSYSLMLDRASGFNIGRLYTENLAIEGGWRGVNASFIDRWDGSITVNDIIAYRPETSSLGIGVSITNINEGNLTIFASGASTASYEAPNHSTPIPAGTKYTRTALQVQKAKQQFKCLLISTDWREAHCLYPVAVVGDHNTYFANVEIHARTSVYTTPVSSFFFEFGSAADRQLAAAFISNNSTLNGTPLHRSAYLATRVTGDVFGQQTVAVGSPVSANAQGALLGKFDFWNSDTSSSLQGVWGSIRAYAADSNGRGAYVSILTGDASNPLAERLRVNSNGSITVLNMPTSAPATSKTLWSDGGTIKITA